MSFLHLSYGRLIHLIANRYLFGSIALSFTPLTSQDILSYTLEGIKDNLIRIIVHVYDNSGYLLHTFSSGRKFSDYFGLDGKEGRKYIASGQYLGYTLTVVPVASRKPVYVFDSITLKLVLTIPSTSAALKHAKVGFGTMQDLLKTHRIHNGHIYSSNSNIN